MTNATSVASALVSTPAARLTQLDTLRGLGIALMLADHAAVIWGAPWWVNGVLTRPGLVAFMLVAGYLARPALGRRSWDVAAAAAISWPLAFSLGLAEVPVLVVFVLCLPLVPVAVWLPVPVLVLAVVQVSAWPMGWHGYEPGTLLALLAAGVLWREQGYTLPRLDWAPLAWVGRYPLTFYVGHLLVLFVLTKA